MGMFDSVYANCPECGQRGEFQSKAGECYMNRYAIDDAPEECLWDVLNDPIFCRGCRTWFALVDPAYPNGKPPKPRPIAATLAPQPETPEQLSSGRYYWPYDRGFTFDDLAAQPKGTPDGRAS